MANYIGKTRTNYFSVTSEEKFRKIMASCWGTNEVIVFDEKQEDDSIKFGFLCNGSIEGFPLCDDGCDSCNPSNCRNHDADYSFDDFCKALQEILPKNEAIIITEVGSEAMRYLLGNCTVITHDACRCINIKHEAIKLAASMMDSCEFTTQMDF
jgi:hypothetical protein